MSVVKQPIEGTKNFTLLYDGEVPMGTAEFIDDQYVYLQTKNAEGYWTHDALNAVWEVLAELNGIK